MRVLIVEDEPKIAKALKRGLVQESFAVDIAYDGDEAYGYAITEPYDIIILDRMIPGSYNGVTLLQEMRTQNVTTPVLFLTARDSTQDRVDGLQAGADDYLVKPFAFEELVARVRALLRRPTSYTPESSEVSGVRLEPEARTAIIDGRSVALSQKEYALLEYMMRNSGRILSKEILIDHVWDYDADILPNTVEAFIKSLRAKIGKDMIQTKRGLGYVFGEAH